MLCDAEVVFDAFLPKEQLDDHKMCICGAILKGLAKPYDCKVFESLYTKQSYGFMHGLK